MERWVYIDLSVIAGAYDNEYAAFTADLFDCFRRETYLPLLSDATLAELEIAPSNIVRKYGEIAGIAEVLHFDEESAQLAKRYSKEGGLPGKEMFDLEQLAIATVNKADIVTSWDYERLVNLQRIRTCNAVNMKYGYPIMEIRSPRELAHAT